MIAASFLLPCLGGESNSNSTALTQSRYVHTSRLDDHGLTREEIFADVVCFRSLSAPRLIPCYLRIAIHEYVSMLTATQDTRGVSIVFFNVQSSRVMLIVRRISQI